MSDLDDAVTAARRPTGAAGRDATLAVALISEVFHEPDGPARLRARLTEARERGAELALLPELPLNPWSPATKEAHPEDAERMGGPRTRAQAEAARGAGIGLVGGIIAIEERTGERRSRALVFDARGQLVATYEKLHLPDEPGFWEPSHYRPGTAPPCRIDGFPMPIGVQVCSDVNRPQGSHLLAAQAVEVILAPRATERRTYDRWLTVFRANALTSAAYVLSVNRPAPEQGVLIGGPSVVVAPDGSVLLETTDPLAVVTLDRAAIERARVEYPGYLAVRAELYAAAWAEIAGGRGE